MKTVLYALCCFSLSASAFAASSNDNSKADCKKNKNCKAKQTACKQESFCDRASFEFYGDFLYLQPNGSDLYYGVEAFPFDLDITVPPVSPNWEVFEIDPSYDPGFNVGFNTFFPSGGNINVGWERFHSHDSASTSTPSVLDMIGPMFDIGPNSTVYSSVKGKAHFEFDTVDLLFGKKICFFDRLMVNLKAGASFARIKETLSSSFASTDGLTARNISTPSTFTGAGTKFGVDFNYELFKNFSFTGCSSISLFMGQLKNSTTYESFSPSLANLDIPQPNTQKTSVPNRTQIIPGFEEKLGFSYDFVFTNCCKLTLAAGYQFQIYINAIQTVDMTAPQVLPSLAVGAGVQDGVYAVGFERTLSNFMLSGPYFTAGISF